VRPYRFHPLARQEFYEADAYYTKVAKELAASFRFEIERAVTRMRLNPLLCPPYGRGSFRKCFVRKFPYVIYFFVLDDSIWITSIAHERRQPGYWLNRKWEE
jgi:plasmid stabilization system protein ParE